MPRAVSRARGAQRVVLALASPVLCPIPVRQSQGLGVSRGDHEADGGGSQLIPCAVREVPALPIVALQGVAVAP